MSEGRREGGSGNLFAAIADSAEEQFTELLSRKGVRIERIVSTGQASPSGFWYDQPQGEWVVMLKGAARLRFADEGASREMRAGDYLYIGPHRRHRVDQTSAEEPTIWLAIHMDEGGGL